MQRTAWVLGMVALVASATAQQAPSQDEKRLKTLEKNYVAAKAAFAKKPKDKALQKKFTTAAALYGHESMVSPILPAKVKYRQAVKVYREVLKYEPNHPVARPEYDLIVKIYKQMGRPVPE